MKCKRCLQELVFDIDELFTDGDLQDFKCRNCGQGDQFRKNYPLDISQERAKEMQKALIEISGFDCMGDTIESAYDEIHGKGAFDKLVR